MLDALAILIFYQVCFNVVLVYSFLNFVEVSD